MTTKIKVTELPEFYAAEYLNSEEEVAAFLTAVLEENDSALLAAALGEIARSRGMTQVAQDSGIPREELHKALRPGSAPRFDTVNRVCAALVEERNKARTIARWLGRCLAPGHRSDTARPSPAGSARG